jgi:hypothetical protein
LKLSSVGALPKAGRGRGTIKANPKLGPNVERLKLLVGGMILIARTGANVVIVRAFVEGIEEGFKTGANV